MWRIPHSYKLRERVKSKFPVGIIGDPCVFAGELAQRDIPHGGVRCAQSPGRSGEDHPRTNLGVDRAEFCGALFPPAPPPTRRNPSWGWATPQSRRETRHVAERPHFLHTSTKFLSGRNRGARCKPPWFFSFLLIFHFMNFSISSDIMRSDCSETAVMH